MKQSLICKVSVLALVAATPAMAELKYDNNSGGSVLLYGQLHPGFQYVDDGNATYSNFVDSDFANSRVGLKATQPYDTFNFGFNFESGLGFPVSSEFDQTGGYNVSGWSRTDLRIVELFAEFNWGRVTVGQGSMASDSTAAVDTSITGLSLYGYTADGNAGFQLYDTNADALSGIRIGQITDYFDGLGRKSRIRYDSPSFNGFSVAASWGYDLLSGTSSTNTFYDIAARYSTQLGSAGKFVAATSYFVNDSSANAGFNGAVVSGSVILDNGFGGDLAWGMQDRDTGPDASYYYAKLFYEQNWFSAGKTGLGIHYWDGGDYVTGGDSSSVWGVGILQKVDDYNSEAYVTYQSYSYSDNTSAEYADLGTLYTGVRWKF